MRKSGILMPVFSLPSSYGIGCFSKEAEKFIDFLEESGQSCWQILPLGPTSYGDSPYQSPSAFAGNPYFIDIDSLFEDGLLKEEECDEYRKSCPGKGIDYNFLYTTRQKILKKAFLRFEPDEDYNRFTQQESFWLQDYAEFAAVKAYFGGRSLPEWDEGVRRREKSALLPLIKELDYEIQYHKFVQYEFGKQWDNIKNYANQRGIEIIGDIPIYIAMDSAESWCHPELFDFDNNGNPVNVAGCPPDAFSDDGQLWGNPVYNWDHHRQTNYQWWVQRMKRSMRLYDVVRIDHFRGFESYYAVPYGSKDAKRGAWRKGGGIDLFLELESKIPDLKIIAEDLGFITDDVRSLLDKTGYPGMKVLQFAFDSREDNDYLPHNYDKNTVVYTGTHDNSTTYGWALDAKGEDVGAAADYMHTGKSPSEICRGMVRLAMASTAETCIIPIQDWLCLGDDARINIPSTLGNNWRWRIESKILDKDIAEDIYRLTVLYGRAKREVDRDV